jgi:hypothetical protein
MAGQIHGLEALAARLTNAANSSGHSTGVKCPAPSTVVKLTLLKNSPSGSDHAHGNSGSCSGHSTDVGVPIRSSGRGGCSASEVATVPDPARYQAIEAVKAPGRE